MIDDECSKFQLVHFLSIDAKNLRVRNAFNSWLRSHCSGAKILVGDVNVVEITRETLANKTVKYQLLLSRFTVVSRDFHCEKKTPHIYGGLKKKDSVVRTTYVRY